MDSAAQKLLAAGFTRETWSYSSIVDPATRADEEYHLIQAMTQPDYANFDKKSLRFQPPSDNTEVLRTVLLPTSYIRLSVSDPQATYADPAICGSQPPFYIKENIYFPNIIMLLQSFLMVHLEEEIVDAPGFRVILRSWAIGYLYHELELREDILDSCSNSAVRRLFNDCIQRFSGRPRGQREKWGKPLKLITNHMIKEFQ